MDPKKAVNIPGPSRDTAPNGVPHSISVRACVCICVCMCMAYKYFLK